MKYYLDTEFNGWGGELISLALVVEDGEEFYWYDNNLGKFDHPWVMKNVIPHIESIHTPRTDINLTQGLTKFLLRTTPEYEWVDIIADWPDDIAYFSRAFIIGAGHRIKSHPNIRMQFVDKVPDKEIQLVDKFKHYQEHNALWDARMLAAKMEK